MKSIVTGGCGFIGSHLVELLLEEGHEVTVFDNLSTGRIENLKHLETNKNLKIIIGDLSNISSLDECVSTSDFIFHLAALADIVPSIVDPHKYYITNVVGTVNLLELARKHNIKKFVYAASSSCYGVPSQYPTPETAKIEPLYPYAYTKWAGEHVVLFWNKIYRIPVISLRLFNVFGPRSRTTGTYGAVFGVFLAQKLNNLPMTIIGDGKQTRDFTFVTDVARAFLLAAYCEHQNLVLNVGSGKTYSINYLAELLGGKKTYIPKRPGEPDITFADNSLIKRILNWSPEIDFESGVNKMLKSIEYWKDAPAWTANSIKEATQEWFMYLGNEHDPK